MPSTRRTRVCRCIVDPLRRPRLRLLPSCCEPQLDTDARAFGIAGAGGLPVVAPLVSLAAFLVGAQVGGLLTARASAAGRPRLNPALLCEGTLLLAAATLARLASVRIGSASAYLMIAGVALAMGVRNATVRRLGVPDLTTTVLTMTLTGLASESLRAGDRRAQARRLGAVVAMLGGAVVGALLVKSNLATPLWLAGAVAFGCRLAVALLPAAAGAPRS